MKDTFRAQYLIDDGYAGPARPKYFNIDADDIEDLTDAELKEFYHEMVEEDFRHRVYPSAEKVEKFVEWAREKLKERASISPWANWELP
jgi:hypothetical protein